MPLVIDVSVFQLLLLTITGWLDRREREALVYLIEENRVFAATDRAAAPAVDG